MTPVKFHLTSKHLLNLTHSFSNILPAVLLVTLSRKYKRKLHALWLYFILNPPPSRFARLCNWKEDVTPTTLSSSTITTTALINLSQFMLQAHPHKLSTGHWSHLILGPGIVQSRWLIDNYDNLWNHYLDIINIAHPHREGAETFLREDRAIKNGPRLQGRGRGPLGLPQWDQPGWWMMTQRSEKSDFNKQSGGS